MNDGIPTSLKLRVITPKQLLVDEDVLEVSLPGLEGLLGILPGHRPLLVTLGDGDLSYKLGNKEEKFGIVGGYAEIQTGSVQVFTRLKEDEELEAD